MPDSLYELESRRAVIAGQFSELGDLRPGSITPTSGRCGKPTCRCHQPGQPGHGPTDRLTYKHDGRTVSESLPTPAAVAKAQREVNEFRKFQQLCREFLEVNAQICRARPVQESAVSAQEKKRPQRSSKKSRAK
jgi:hypothetical protein